MGIRKIVFRGKRIDTGEWVYGDLHTRCQKPHIHPDVPNCPISGLKFNIDPDTVGQYTGLTDRNGKDVYEGDIALMDYSDFNTGKDGKIYAVVRWIDDRAAFMWDAGLNYYADMRNDVEICGNIHDNPELLEDGE